MSPNQNEEAFNLRQLGLTSEANTEGHFKVVCCTPYYIIMFAPSKWWQKRHCLMSALLTILHLFVNLQLRKTSYSPMK